MELRAWLNHPHVHLRHSAAKALSKLTGQQVFPPHVERPEEPFRAPYLPKTAKFVVKTEKGDFEVEPLLEESPLTAGQHVLARAARLFRNLTFHRVVPDFVAQGGDPRGDGEGGPGYTIRCEINHQPYARGVVGMALSGQGHRRQPVLRHALAAAAPGWPLHRVRRGHQRAGRGGRLLEGDPILEINAR